MPRQPRPPPRPEAPMPHSWTLDHGVAALYGWHGYRSVAVVSGYVGPFNRHVLLKLLNPPAIEPWT